MGMLAAVEVWRGGRELETDFAEWKRWYAHISARITKIDGVTAADVPPLRGGPFPTLRVSWDPNRIGITAGDVGRKMLQGEPRIMTQAAGEGNSFLIRPVAMKPDDYRIVADRLFEVLSSAPAGTSAAPLRSPALNIAGVWDIDIEYEMGTARHKVFLAVSGNQINGNHQGWAYEGDVQGQIDGDQVTFRSTMPADGNVLTYAFSGSVSDAGMSGDLLLGEYGRARWRGVRHTAA